MSTLPYALSFSVQALCSDAFVIASILNVPACHSSATNPLSCSSPKLCVFNSFRLSTSLSISALIDSIRLFSNFIEASSTSVGRH